MSRKLPPQPNLEYLKKQAKELLRDLARGNQASKLALGYVLMARWRGSHFLETVARRDGQSAGWGTYEVSTDGDSLIVSGDQQMIVLDRFQL